MKIIFFMSQAFVFIILQDNYTGAITEAILITQSRRILQANGW